MLAGCLPPSGPSRRSSFLVQPMRRTDREAQGGWLRMREEDARFVASAPKQTKTEGFRVPHVLRDFVSVRTARLVVVSFSRRARGPLTEKKDAEIARVCKTRVLLFQSHRRPAIETRQSALSASWGRRIWYRGSSPPNGWVVPLLGEKIRKREIFTFYTSIPWIFNDVLK